MVPSCDVLISGPKKLRSVRAWRRRTLFFSILLARCSSSIPTRGCLLLKYVQLACGAVCLQHNMSNCVADAVLQLLQHPFLTQTLDDELGSAYRAAPPAE